MMTRMIKLVVSSGGVFILLTIMTIDVYFGIGVLIVRLTELSVVDVSTKAGSSVVALG